MSFSTVLPRFGPRTRDQAIRFRGTWRRWRTKTKQITFERHSGFTKLVIRDRSPFSKPQTIPTILWSVPLSQEVWAMNSAKNLSITRWFCRNLLPACASCHLWMGDDGIVRCQRTSSTLTETRAAVKGTQR